MSKLCRKKTEQVFNLISCRGCGGRKLSPVFSLPPQNIVDYLDSKQAVGAKYPLNLLECQDCSLVQLDYTFPREKLYKHYYYRSGTSEQQVAWLKDVVQATLKRVGPRKGIWLDIGANDGTLLKQVPDGWVKVGFEPAKNLAAETEKLRPEIFIVNDFFKRIPYFHTNDGVVWQKPQVITCTGMFYDLDNPHLFLDDIRQILADDGIFVIQQNYLPTMLVNNGYDNISHEHLCYYSLKSLEAVLAAHNLVVVAVELNEVNGGSFRAYIKHGPEDVDISVHNLRSYEESALTPSAWREFRSRVEDSKMILTEFLTQAKKKGKITWIYGASNRGQIILQYCGIGSDLVMACADRNPAKHGRKTVTGIPIRSEEQMRNTQPDYLLILPYFYLSSFLIRELEYLDAGGEFLVPLPTVKLINKKGNKIVTRILK